jgi:hypothetical protein
MILTAVFDAVQKRGVFCGCRRLCSCTRFLK